MNTNIPNKKMRKSASVPLKITALSALLFTAGCGDDYSPIDGKDMRVKLSSNIVTMVDGKSVTNKVYYYPPYVSGHRYSSAGLLIPYRSSSWLSDDHHHSSSTPRSSSSSGGFFGGSSSSSKGSTYSGSSGSSHSSPSRSSSISRGGFGSGGHSSVS